MKHKVGFHTHLYFFILDLLFTHEETDFLPTDVHVSSLGMAMRKDFSLNPTNEHSVWTMLLHLFTHLFTLLSEYIEIACHRFISPNQYEMISSYPEIGDANFKCAL